MGVLDVILSIFAYIIIVHRHRLSDCMSYSLLLKYIIIGDSGVGKSCLLLQYTDQRYRDKHEVTIGVEFGAKTLRLAQNNIKLQVWDTAGQQSFKAITRGYYRNAIGAIVCYDVSNRESFNHVTRWLEEAQSNGPESLFFILVGNKSDKQAERKVSFEEGLRLAKEKNIPFLETSAKNGTNVEEIFTILTQSVLQEVEQNQVSIREHPGLKVGNEKYVPSRQSFMQSQQQEANIMIGGNGLKDQKGSRCCGGKK